MEWIYAVINNTDNYTRDATEGLAEQLHTTILMAWQNRLVLDMTLAETGGSCKLIY